MTTFIFGGSGSGKSAYAEDCAAALSGGGKKYYIATMQVFDAEGERKIERHRELRRGKCFCTIEQPVDIGRATEKMEPGERTALLECVSNLTANEMFSGEAPKAEDAVADKVVEGILSLQREVTHLILVGNNVFEDGNDYDEVTTAYLRAMGRIQGQAARLSDVVVEVVAGIPIVIKQKKGC